MRQRRRTCGLVCAFALIALLAGSACAPRKGPVPVPAPEPAPAPTLEAEILARPAPATVEWQGREVGQTPVTVQLAGLDQLKELSARLEGQDLSETRVLFLDASHLRVEYLFASEPTPLAKALGLARILVFDYGEQVAFDVDRADLKPAAAPLLQRQAEMLKSHFATVDVYVCGHTDSTGGEAHNLELSLQRARTVADFLKAQGVDNGRLRIQGFGQAFPVASNDTPVDRARNRRTEIVLPQ